METNYFNFITFKITLPNHQSALQFFILKKILRNNDNNNKIKRNKMCLLQKKVIFIKNLLTLNSLHFTQLVTAVYAYIFLYTSGIPYILSLLVVNNKI